MQNELFDHHDATKPLAIVTRDGHVEYFNHFYGADEAEHLYKSLLNSLPWEADEIKMFGKLVKTARKVVWVGNPECAYTYSGVQKAPQAWTNPLLQMKHKLEQFTGYTYNSCLLNLYHSGAEGMGWHSDDERELDSKNPIASVSLGARRKFAFRHRQDKTTTSVFVGHGSVLIMHPPTQEYWHHSLLKTTAITSPRINLTFRKILPRM
jgi:alkylated DNA repair dioxygenase AlkB